MNKIFLTVLNMSLSGAFVIAVIALVRFPLKKAPKIITYGLWAVAGFRLMFPFHIRGLFSLLPFNSTPIPPDLAARAIPQIDSGIAIIDQTVSSALPAASAAVGTSPLQTWLTIGSSIWLAGVVVMLLYSILSMIRLKRQLGGAVNVGDNIYETANLKTPFVIGLFHPQIFIPAGLTAEERRYIILHEQMHIQRRDPAIKILAHFILCLHWFNPFAWLAFLLMSADMEMSCDERVVEKLGGQIKTAYSRSLIRLAAGWPIFNGSPLAFGEGEMKERINNVLNFKKPSRFIIISTVILVAALGLGLSLSRDNETPMRDGEIEPPLPKLTITTPRDLYSPFMSSIFGFELVVQGAPTNTVELNYVCDQGSFCTYGDDRIKDQGDNVTTVERIYWTAFSGKNQGFITEDGEILITVTALDKKARVLAAGNVLVECGNGGEWFKFLGGKPADPYSAEKPAPTGDSSEEALSPEAAAATEPAELIRSGLIAAGFKVIDVREYGARFIEHSTITSPAGSKTEDNEVVIIYAEYKEQNGEPVIMNYTLRRPVTGKTGWTHGEPIPFTDRGQFGPIPPKPTGEPYSSAATAARKYYRQQGYPEEAGMTIRVVRADYSGENETFLNRLKGETVTLGVEFASDPKSHPLRAIVLTRETGGKWEVVRADK